MDWKKIEIIIGESLPTCVKSILSVSGYDTFASIKNISVKSILEIQQHISLHSRQTIAELNCCHCEFYQSQEQFEFLPGHKDLILALPSFNFNDPQMSTSVHTQENKFSFIMQNMIDTAKEAVNKLKIYKYSDIIKYFATFVFLLCGRSCYEFLNSNLPLPSTKTVCKYKFTRFK